LGALLDMASDAGNGHPDGVARAVARLIPRPVRFLNI